MSDTTQEAQLSLTERPRDAACLWKLLVGHSWLFTITLSSGAHVFLLVFNSNYISILYCFRDTQR